MRIIRGLRNLKKSIRASAVTIGVFDGVHIGHRKIISRVVDTAKKNNIESVVVTFDPHPAKVLSPSENVPSLLSLDHRLKLLGEMGVDIAVVINFARPFAGIDPEFFVNNILAKKLGARFIFTGENFYFGKNAKAGIRDLKLLAGRIGIKVCPVKPVRSGKEVVSSSLIRKYVASGELKKSERLLGRSVSILGTVVPGARFARALGYPTANINPHHEAMPPAGVYAVKVRVGRKIRGGVLNIGVKPTFYAPRDKEPDIEAHIFNFKSRIYGKDIEIYFMRKIRDERRFKDAASLVRQIEKDRGLARKVLDRQ